MLYTCISSLSHSSSLLISLYIDLIPSYYTHISLHSNSLFISFFLYLSLYLSASLFLIPYLILSFSLLFCLLVLSLHTLLIFLHTVTFFLSLSISIYLTVYQSYFYILNSCLSLFTLSRSFSLSPSLSTLLFINLIPTY